MCVCVATEFRAPRQQRGGPPASAKKRRTTFSNTQFPLPQCCQVKKMRGKSISCEHLSRPTNVTSGPGPANPTRSRAQPDAYHCGRNQGEHAVPPVAWGEHQFSHLRRQEKPIPRPVCSPCARLNTCNTTIHRRGSRRTALVGHEGETKITLRPAPQLGFILTVTSRTHDPRDETLASETWSHRNLLSCAQTAWIPSGLTRHGDGFHAVQESSSAGWSVRTCAVAKR